MEATIVKKGGELTCCTETTPTKRTGNMEHKQHWRCVHPGYPGWIHTINDSVENRTAQVVHFKDHDHFADATAAHTTDVKAELCKMAAEQRHVPLKQLYIELSHRPEIVAAAETIPGFESCKT